ncbi:hypothetical protein GJ496_003109 [Pomphorhynchus laevis]|nr:hypothetical protein GJ496_003109 [Pomphorhynchus laevis]
MMHYQVGSEHIEKIISMPRKHGGLNIIDPCQGAAQEYNYSLSVSEPAMQEIEGMEAAKMQDRIRQEIKADKQNNIQQVRADLKSASDDLLTIIENASRIGSSAWLDPRNLDNKLFLNMNEFRYALVRYNWKNQSEPLKCNCGQDFDIPHALAVTQCSDN